MVTHTCAVRSVRVECKSAVATAFECAFGVDASLFASVERVGQTFVHVQTFSASTVELKAGETLAEV